MTTLFFGEGFVRLDDCMADDHSVVNAARVSFGKVKDGDEQLSEADAGLIKFLMRERHGTPFEHNSFRFHVKCPIFVAREWFRHRIGSFNEFSARYSEMPNEFYRPRLRDVRSQVGKPGAYTFEAFKNQEDAADVIKAIDSANLHAYGVYQSLIDKGVAKELARTVLPVGAFTQFYWTLNARSLMNFLSLRTDTNAQYEIREYAKLVEVHFAQEMPVTHKNWVEFGKVCP